MNEDAYETVIIEKYNVIGLIIEHGLCWAKVRFTIGGIEHEEYLTDEDYQLLEEWVKDES